MGDSQTTERKHLHLFDFLLLLVNGVWAVVTAVIVWLNYHRFIHVDDAQAWAQQITRGRLTGVFQQIEAYVHYGQARWAQLKGLLKPVLGKESFEGAEQFERQTLQPLTAEATCALPEAQQEAESQGPQKGLAANANYWAGSQLRQRGPFPRVA